MVKLHLGAGDLKFIGWVNLDLSRGHDLRRGLTEWRDGEAEQVYSCHFLEHVTFEEGRFLLREVYRVLAPGGVVRLGVPDFELFARAYVRGDESFSAAYFERYCGPASDEDPGGAAAFRQNGAAGALLAIIYGWGHRAVYDAAILRRTLERAGFPSDSIHRCVFGQSYFEDLCALDQHFADHTLFLEARKPDTESSA